MRVEGCRLLFLHGLYGAPMEWRPLERDILAGLSLGRENSLRLPLPNHAAGPLMPCPTLAGMGEWVLGALDGARVGALVLVGHSAGARVAHWLAARLPERFPLLVMLDGLPEGYPLSPLLAAAHRQIARALLASRGCEGAPRGAMRDFLRGYLPDEALVEYLLTNYACRAGRWAWRIGVEGIARYVQGLTARALPPARLEQPVLLVRSAGAGYAPEEQVEDWGRYTPRLEVVSLEGAHHALHVMAREAVREAVCRFVERHWTNVRGFFGQE